MKKVIALTMVLVAMVVAACNDKPANSSYHNSSNNVRQDNKAVVNTNANVNVNANVNANVNK